MACAPPSGLGVGVTGALGVSAAPPCALRELVHCPLPQGSQGLRLCPCLFNPADGYSVSTLGIGWRRLFCPPLVGKHLPNAQLARVCFLFSFLIRVSPVKWLFFLSHMYPHLSGLARLHRGGDSRPIGTWNPGVRAWLARHWTACICCSVWSGAATGTGLLG